MKTTRVFLIMVVGFALTTGVRANTLDRRLIAINGGIIQLGGDQEDAFSDMLDTIYTYGASVQLPLGDYVALLGGIQRTTSSIDMNGSSGDITGLGFSGGLRFQVPVQDIPIMPFVSLQYDYTITEYELELISPELTTGAINLAVGVEWSLTDRFSLIGSFARISEQTSELKINGDKIDLADEIGTENSNVILGSMNFWMADNVLLSGLFAYESEEKTQTYQIALGLSF